MRNIYGDEINLANGKRSVWRCDACDDWVFKTSPWHYSAELVPDGRPVDMAPMEKVLVAIEVNHKWHLEYDDNEGYLGSELHNQNEEAIRLMKELINAQKT